MISGRRIIYFGRKLKFKILTFYIICIVNIYKWRFAHRPLTIGRALQRYRRRKPHKIQDVFIYRKCLIVKLSDNWDSISSLFCYWVAIEWFCEKFKVNLEFTRDSDSKGTETFFENYTDVEQYCKNHSKSDITTADVSKVVFPRYTGVRIGEYLVPPEAGYKTLSKLSVRSDLEKHTDEYIALNTNEDWVAVHFRGTDVIALKDKLPFRYTITLESYIVYLKEVLDNHCRIFVCSDQAQFIDEMQVAFSGRVFTRDIERSTNHERLHKMGSKRHSQRKKDAFMDLLVLARAKLIYTTGSGFVDVIRFFNPKTKIISLDGRKRSGNNYLPIPKKDLYDSLSIKNRTAD